VAIPSHFYSPSRAATWLFTHFGVSEEHFDAYKECMKSWVRLACDCFLCFLFHSPAESGAEQAAPRREIAVSVH
jgi:hypothetical protein